MSLNETPSNNVSGRPRRVFESGLMEKWSSEDQLEGPIFLQLAWFLTNLIIEGELKEGELLPSETTLADQFGMSRMTARRGIETLKDLGIVSRSRRGTRIEISDDEAASVSSEFWQLLNTDQITLSQDRPLGINRRLDARPDAMESDMGSGPLQGRSPNEDLTSRIRRLARVTESESEAFPDAMPNLQMQSASLSAPMQSASMPDMEDSSGITRRPPTPSRVRADSRPRDRQQLDRVSLDASEPEVDKSVAAVGVGKLGHEVVAHLVANLIEESRSFSGGRPIPGLRVVGIDRDQDPFIQTRSPIQRALRSLGRLSNLIHLGPEVDLVSSSTKSLALNDELKGLELCFLVGALADVQGHQELSSLIRALDGQGTKTIALVSIPEDWESGHILSAAKGHLRDILDTKASVIAVPVGSIGMPGEDLAWEDHLQEIVQYFSSAFETLLRASSWTEGASNITLSDIYSVLRPGHQGALSLSQVSGIERTARIEHILEDGVERLRRQNVDLNEASRMLAILSGSRSFTRSEVQGLMAGIRRISGEGTEIFFGTSRTPADADEFYLTLIV